MEMNNLEKYTFTYIPGMVITLFGIVKLGNYMVMGLPTNSLLMPGILISRVFIIVMYLLVCYMGVVWTSYWENKFNIDGPLKEIKRNGLEN